MDERIKEAYRKIYAELFHLVLILCCISVVIKFAFLGKRATECFPEYFILTGTPVYLFVRTRMLGVTQISAASSRKKNRRYLSVVCGLIAALLVFTASLRARSEEIHWGSVLVFGATFLAAFLLVGFLVRKLEQRRQKKLDSKYDD